MSNPLVRVLLALSIGAALSSGSALAKVGNESKKPATKTVVLKKKDSHSKDAAARRARMKKMGSAATKDKTNPPARAMKAHSHRGSPNNSHPAGAAHAQVASNSDDGSAAERRARIHTMRVPE